MKAVILAGGFGSRLSEETDIRPKPMVEIGGKPIIWHIMKQYARHGINDFVICLGYKAEYVKRYFIDYSQTSKDFQIDLMTGEIKTFQADIENWKINLLDTGLTTMTGGRIKKVIEQLKISETFCLTYGDGLSDVYIKESIKFHRAHGKLATVTAVTPPGRFGILEIDDNRKVSGFREKIVSDQYRINGGFFVLEPSIIDYIADDQTSWEQSPLQELSLDGQLLAWEHNGFWHPMDTLRDKMHLQKLWDEGDAPWSMQSD